MLRHCTELPLVAARACAVERLDQPVAIRRWHRTREEINARPSLDAASGPTWTERNASSITDVSNLCHRAQKAHEDCNSRRAETAPVTNETDRSLQGLDWNCAVRPDYPTRTTFCDPGKRPAGLGQTLRLFVLFSGPRSAQPLSEGHPIRSEPSRTGRISALARTQTRAARTPQAVRPLDRGRPRHNCWNPPGTKY